MFGSGTPRTVRYYGRRCCFCVHCGDSTLLTPDAEGEQVSLLSKIAISQCCNSVLVLVVVYWSNKGDWYVTLFCRVEVSVHAVSAMLRVPRFLVERWSLGTKALQLVFLNAFVPPLVSFLYFLFAELATCVGNPVSAL